MHIDLKNLHAIYNIFSAYMHRSIVHTFTPLLKKKRKLQVCKVSESIIKTISIHASSITEHDAGICTQTEQTEYARELASHWNLEPGGKHRSISVPHRAAI